MCDYICDIGYELVGDKFVNVNENSSKVKCEICGREFDSLIKLSKHTHVHKISTQEYYDKYLKKDGEDICNKDSCNSTTRFYGMVLGYSDFCSRKCSALGSKINLENITCQICGKVFKGFNGLSYHLRNKSTFNHPTPKEYKLKYLIDQTELKVECQICGRKFKNFRALGHHLKAAENHPNSKEYYDLYIRKEGEGICMLDGCENETTFRGFQAKYDIFCCMKHRDQSPEMHKKRVENNIKSWKDPKSGHNSKECREKMSIATQARWDDPDNFFNSQELRDRRREYMKEIWDDPDGVFNSPEYRELKSSIMKKLWEDPECFWRSDKFLDQVIPKRKEYMLNGGAVYTNSFVNREEHTRKLKEWMLNGGAAYIQSFITNPSKPQVELFEITKSLYDTSVLNYPSLNFSIDIAIPDLNIAIEYDGSYWHKGREEADAKRQKLLENEGWKFLRYVDYVPSLEELKKDIKQIILKEIN